MTVPKTQKNGVDLVDRTTITFETKPLEECIEISRRMDRLCFPREMWMSTTELNELLRAQAEATVLMKNLRAIGMAITITELSAASLLSDKEFTAHEDGIYSYSESILPEYQNQGYGSLLLNEISIRMRKRGFRYISAHVRTRYGWNIRRYRKMNVNESRFLYDFWEDPLEKVQYQRAAL